jgi:hypothetical protein
MKNRIKLHLTGFKKGLLLGSAVFTFCQCDAQNLGLQTEDFGWQDLSVGARGGVSLDGGANRFRQVESFADLDLPWRWNFYSDWSFQPGFDFAAGWLAGDHAEAFIGSLGPELTLRKGKFPIALEGGASPTFLSRYQFGEKNFGEDFQFTSHLGVDWKIARHFDVDLRFQHMSNAGISSHNPGLNMLMLSTSYHF